MTTINIPDEASASRIPETTATAEAAPTSSTSSRGAVRRRRSVRALLFGLIAMAVTAVGVGASASTASAASAVLFCFTEPGVGGSRIPYVGTVEVYVSTTGNGPWTYWYATTTAVGGCGWALTTGGEHLYIRVYAKGYRRGAWSPLVAYPGYAQPYLGHGFVQQTA